MIKKIKISLLSVILFTSCNFNMFFYYPSKGFEPAAGINYKEVFITSGNGNKIHSLIISPDSNVKATVFVLHGNAGSMSGWMTMAPPFTKAGYRVMIVDYEGFGVSEGSPTHKRAWADACAAFDYILNNEAYNKDKIIIYGLSLGGNLSIKLAEKYQDRIQALVTEGAFTNQRDIAMKMTPWYLRFVPYIFGYSYIKGENLIRDIKVPKLIIHSTEDEVIPYEMGKELYENAVEPKELWTIQGRHLEAISKYRNQLIQKFDSLVVN